MKCIPTGFSEATGIGATLIVLLDQRWPTEKLTWDFDPEHKGRRWFNEMYAMAQPKHAYLDDFAEHFRMSRSSFEELLLELADTPARTKDTKFRAAVPYHHRVGMALWRLANGAETHRQITAQFGGGKTTSWQAFRDVVRAICNTMLNKYIRFPNTERATAEIIQKFEINTGYPMCLGAVDCTHVAIDEPNHDFPEAWQNRCNFASVIVQAS